MHAYIDLALTWIGSNIVAIIAGGYLEYRFGPHVEAAVGRFLGYLKRAV